MNEILYKAKDKLTGEWMEGLVLNADHTKFGHYDDGINFAFFDSIPETVCRFTGITDKNGTKVFEGDIVEAITIDTNTPQRAVVGFGQYVDANTSDEYIGFYLTLGEYTVSAAQLLVDEIKDRFDVIGNRHDNVELLEEVR